MLFGNFLLGAGEVCLMPTIISSITRLAPSQLKGTIMGTLYLALAFSGYFAGLIARWTTVHSSASAIGGYAQVYTVIAQSTLMVAIIGFIIYFFIHRAPQKNKCAA